MSAFSLLPRRALRTTLYHPLARTSTIYETCRRISSTNENTKLGPSSKNSPPKVDLEALLATPTWSVQSLLPTQDQMKEENPVSSEQLRHLLRLSALPLPSTQEEEKKMLDTLVSQLHFVREMQKVDTTGVEPLRAIRDETAQAEKDQEITLNMLKKDLQQEDVVGTYYKRIRRKIPAATKPARQPEGWDPLSHATRTSGKFFVVDSGKGAGEV